MMFRRSLGSAGRFAPMRSDCQPHDPAVLTASQREYASWRLGRSRSASALAGIPTNVRRDREADVLRCLARRLPASVQQTLLHPRRKDGRLRRDPADQEDIRRPRALPGNSDQPSAQTEPKEDGPSDPARNVSAHGSQSARVRSGPSSEYRDYLNHGWRQAYGSSDHCSRAADCAPWRGGSDGWRGKPSSQARLCRLFPAASALQVATVNRLGICADRTPLDCPRLSVRRVRDGASRAGRFNAIMHKPSETASPLPI